MVAVFYCMEAKLNVGEQFQVHFVWKLTEGDWLRAIFSAEILALQPREDRYLVNLSKFIGGWQEDPNGKKRPKEEMSREWWARIVQLQGRKVQLAYEAADGRPLYMRLPTLTGEHVFFRRFEDEDSTSV